MNVEIACIVDRSGSMDFIAKDAIGGFNAFLKEQQAVPGEAQLTLVLFNHKYHVAMFCAPIKNVQPLTYGVYQPHGTTALYDAIGRTINEIGMRLDSSAHKPDKVIVAIITDGLENASHEFTHAQVAEMIKHQQEKYSWEFVFLAANQDAFQTGAALNIPTANTANFAYSPEGVKDAYSIMSNTTRSIRSR